MKIVALFKRLKRSIILLKHYTTR